MAKPKLAFLFDVDNTLLDNDRVKEDLQERIEELVGARRAAKFWELYEEVRRETDYVDLPETLRLFRVTEPGAKNFPYLSGLVLGYPFDAAVYPGAREAVAHLKTLGAVAILSDGDPIYQAAKIARSGLADAVDGNVLVYAHKERHLDEVLERVPAERHVLVDDKPELLAAAKAVLGDDVVTVHVKQGKYAKGAKKGEFDVTVDRIGDLTKLGAEVFTPS